MLLLASGSETSQTFNLDARIIQEYFFLIFSSLWSNIVFTLDSLFSLWYALSRYGWRWLKIKNKNESQNILS